MKPCHHNLLIVPDLVDILDGIPSSRRYRLAWIIKFRVHD